MPLLGAANLSLNKAHDRGRQCNSKARADICKQLLARASLDYSPNPPGGWDLARSRVFSQSLSRDPFAGLALDYLRALNLLNYQY